MQDEAGLFIYYFFVTVSQLRSAGILSCEKKPHKGIRRGGVWLRKTKYVTHESFRACCKTMICHPNSFQGLKTIEMRC